MSSKLFLASAACLMVSASAEQTSTRVLPAKAVLGVEGAANNSTGDLAISGDALVFSRREGPAARVPLNAIQAAFLSQQDAQVGGTPMAVGRAVAPFGAGRVVGLFSHKKYEFVTVQYVDADNAFHAAVYQLNNGAGQTLAKELDANGVHVAGLRMDVAKGEEKKDAK